MDPGAVRSPGIHGLPPPFPHFPPNMKPRRSLHSSALLHATSLIVISLGVGSQVQAGTLFWDGADLSTAGAQGGAGTWDSATTANWWNSSADVVWPSSGTDNDAVFGGTSGTVTIASGGVTANDLSFNTTGYILSGTGTLTLNGTTPTITTASGVTTTFGNNTAMVIAGSAGLTKTGTGTLVLNGSAVNTFTGGVVIKGGNLTLNYGNLATPTNLVNSSNSLTIGGGTLTITGKAAGTTSQTFAGTTATAGASTITIARNGSSGSATLNLGALNRSVGNTITFNPSNAWVGSTTAAGGTASTTEIVTLTGTSIAGSSVTLPTSGNTGYIGAGVFYGSGAGTRYAMVRNTGSTYQLVSGATSVALLTTGGSASTVYNLSAASSLTGAATNYALINNSVSAFSFNQAGFGYTTNGFLNINTGTTTISGGTITIGSERDLVINAANTGGYSIGSVIANNGAGASNLTVNSVGAGVTTLSATNTFTGQVNVNVGKLVLGTGGSVNTASAINLNGGSLVQTNTSTAVTPTVTIQGGTLDGTGTVNAVVVSDDVNNVITNGNSGTGALTLGSLTLNGDGTLNVRTAGSAGIVVTGALTTTPASGSVVVNVAAGPTWVTGTTYNLVSYGSFSGSTSDFTKGTIAGLGARQIGTLGNSGSAITLSITGDSARWTGAASGAWTTNTVGSPYNWKTVGGLADTEFLVSDDVLFDDSASGTTTLDITTANVSPNTITFNNSSKNYTISSSGGFGIASGSITKNGTGTVSISTANTFTGTTTINAGTVQISGGAAISNTGLVSLANTAGATFQVSGSETIGTLSGGGATGGSVVLDAGQTLTLSSGTQTYSGAISGAGTLTSSGAAQTLNGIISSSGGINVTTGVLALGGSANSFTGTTTISAGAGLVVTADNALGSTGTGNGTTVTGATGALGFAAGVNYTALEKVSGSGTGNTVTNGAFAAVQRGFIQSISGNNTFAGAVEINATGISRIGTQEGSTLNLTGAVTMASGVTGVTMLFRPGSSNGDYVILSNSGNSWDTDTQIFTGNNGTGAGVRLGANNALPTNLSIQANAGTGTGTTFDMAGYNQSFNGLKASSAAFKITNTVASTNSVLTLNNLSAQSNSNTAIQDGAGTISLVKQGSFTQNLGATNNYSGTTTIQAGTLQFTKAAALYNNTASNWTASKITVESGATLGLNVGGTGEFTATDVGTIATNLTSGISNNGLRSGSFLGLNVTAATTVSSVLTDSTGTGGGAVGLVKTGTAILTLDQANTYSGGTALNDGYITASHNSALGTGTLTFGTGAERLQLSDGINLANDIVINGGNGGVGNGAIQNANATAGENVTISGDISLNSLVSSGGHFASQGGGTLNLTGSITSSVVASVRAGTVVFSGGGSYTDMQVTGTARLGANNGLATNATVDLGPAGATGNLDLAGYNQSLVGVTRSTANGAVIGNSSTTTDSTLTLTGSSTFGGVIQNALGSGTKKLNLTINGSGQTTTLSGANTYTGDTTIKAGTLKLNTSTTISGSNRIVVGDAGSTATVLDVTAAGLNLGTNQTLAGIGTVLATGQTITASGTIAPGNSPGTLTIDGGTLSLNGTSNFIFELGTSSDLITLMNSASLNLGSGTLGLADFVFSDSGGFGVGTYTLIGGASSFTGTLDSADLTGTVLGYNSTLSMSGSNLVLTVVPEPGVALLGGLGLLAVFRRRRQPA